jgi:outer membrane protein
MMMRTIPAFALLAILLASPSPGFSQDAAPVLRPMVLTLDSAIALARINNRDLLIADQNRSRADAQIDEAWADALPQFSISGSYSRNILVPVFFVSPNTPMNPTKETAKFVIGSKNSYQAGVQVSQPLFSRKVGVALDIANDYREYSEQAYQSTEQGVELTVKRAFYTILLAQQLVSANRQGLEVVKANLENVESLYRHGSAAEYDLLRAQVQLANTEPLLTSAENGLALAKNALKNLLALPMEQDVDVTGEFKFDRVPEETLELARRNALASNPSIAQLALQESMMEKNIEIAQAAYFPTLSLVGAYRWLTEDNSFEFADYNWAQTMNVGVVLSFTVFDGFRTSARAQQAIIDRQKVRLARLEAEGGLKIQIQSTELNMVEARKRMEGLERSIEQAQKAVSIAQTRFRSGVGTQLELLDTQVAMTRVQTTYAQAVYDYNVARAEWEYSVGGLK